MKVRNNVFLPQSILVGLLLVQLTSKNIKENTETV